MVVCSNCGVEVGESSFCPNCGSKIVKETPKHVCSACGADVGSSNFCPNCGSKVLNENPKSVCPNCGFDVGDSAFCPKCGTKIQIKSNLPQYSKSDDVQADENDFVDDLIEFDGTV